MTEKNGVAVYCASSSKVGPKYLSAARDTGRLIACAGFDLVCGGGVMGLMAAAIEGAVDAGGRAVGVLPEFMISKGWAHPRLTEMVDTPSMHVRKETMAARSRAVIALPGGIGTLDELCEMMTWHQLELFRGPVIIVNTDGFFDPFVSMLERMREEGFMRGDVIPAIVVSTPAEAIEIIAASDSCK